MPQLRLTLLIIGALFILAVILFEIRRSRRNRPLTKVMGETAAEPPRSREPTMSLPEIHVRHPATPLPSLQISEADSMVGLRLDTAHPEDSIALDTPSMTVAGNEAIEATAAFPAMVPLAPLTPETTIGLVSTAVESDLSGEPLSVGAPSEPVMTARNLPSDEPQPAPIVAWPDEAERHIYSVRLMSTTPDRFQGRALRLALADEGFVHGAFDIFHKPAADSRVVVSASSLTKPGTFDPSTIDTQRFLGVSLFVVLPGPLSPRAAVDEMFRAGGELALRLSGALQDDQGRPVTPEIIAGLRETAARDSAA